MKSLVAVLLLCCPLTLIADQGHQHQFNPNEKLGTVHFSISCKGQQVAFERGVALLHTFWYDHAQAQFEQIADKDPQCAIAYWGQAMSIFHQIWDRPSDATMKKGLALVQKGEKIGAKTQRERDYINALAVFYRGGYADYQARIDAYTRTMEKLYQKYPQDHEAGAFYSLSLLASAPPKDTSFVNEKKAVAILDKLFEQEPDHPGIPHYIIHSTDTPQLAPLGLNAARRYASIAPSAPHAVHMPSHIFARLGLWQEDIQSNLGSIAAAEKSGSMGHALHAMDFLSYAYLQVGEDDKSRAVVAKLATMDGGQMQGHDMHEYMDMARAEFPATYYIETRNWKEAAALRPAKDAAPQNAAITYWARATGSGRLKDAAAAKKDLDQYDAMVEALKKTANAYMAEFMDTERDEIRAWVAFAEGKNDEAAQIMRTVADKQDARGKAEVAIPAREMLADILLEAGHAEQALAEYEQSMKIDPNRFNGIYGAARAAELAKEPDTAAKYYAQLVKNCAGSKSERSELARAKEQLAGKTAVGGS